MVWEEVEIRGSLPMTGKFFKTNIKQKTNKHNQNMKNKKPTKQKYLKISFFLN